MTVILRKMSTRDQYSYLHAYSLGRADDHADKKPFESYGHHSSHVNN